MSEHPQHAPESTADAVRMVGAAVAASQFEQAAALADTALAHGFIDPSLYNARALWLERQRRDDEALTEYRRARALAPKSSAILNAIGLCLIRLYRPDEAIEAFDEAIRINPGYAPSHQRRGTALGMAGRSRDAEASLRRAASLDPRNAEALANIATMEARKRDFAAAARNAERALAVDAHNTTAHVAMALVEIERREFAKAEARLVALLAGGRLAGTARAIVLGILGDARDGQDRCHDAFADYAAANAELRAVHAPRFAEKVLLGEMLDRMTGWLENTAPESWTAGELSGQHPSPHAFILGFYRSGTTLLEQILASHPAVATVEERELLAEAGERYLTSAEGIGRLSRLEGHELESARAIYWERTREIVPTLEGKLLVDKHPLNTAKLPLIRKLFPGAKIIFAVRDPRDVVLSCFRRHLQINAAMFELLTLEGAAHLYDRTMGFAELCGRLLRMDTCEIRSESLVSGFEDTLATLCGFLEIPYSGEMENFAAHAAARDIRSPSAEQVRRGISAESIGRWRCYQDDLAPVLPVLEPWVQRFGY
ncbi:MAG TPA: sulfotransferase [Rhizomicrobium sp.]|nr:sulfotransferase [Rhizomicrobium sp.]